MNTPARIPLLFHARILAGLLATVAHPGIDLLQAIEKKPLPCSTPAQYFFRSAEHSFAA
jgi:hypothetical protein